MPLSEHEQRMLDEIENALYEEDPKFASQVRARRFSTSSGKRRLQAVFVVLCGLALLVVGVATPALHLGGVPVLSVLGFVVMFLGGVMLIVGVPWGKDETGSSASSPKASRPMKGRFAKNKSAGGFTDRMEERFRRRFE